MRVQARRHTEACSAPDSHAQIIEVDSSKGTLFEHLRVKLARAWRRWRWQRRVAALGARSELIPPAWIEGGKSVAIGCDVRIWRFARIEAFNAQPGIIRVDIGDGTVIQPFMHIGAALSVRIGKGCLFASHVYITDHDHDFSDPMEPVISNNRVVASPVSIGDYVWLGERVMVLKGVSIGERSVVGAGSVVTRDVPPMSIAVGSPARVVRRWNQLAGTWERVESA